MYLFLVERSMGEFNSVSVFHRDHRLSSPYPTS